MSHVRAANDESVQCSIAATQLPARGAMGRYLLQWPPPAFACAGDKEACTAGGATAGQGNLRRWSGGCGLLRSGAE